MNRWLATVALTLLLGGYKGECNQKPSKPVSHLIHQESLQNNSSVSTSNTVLSKFFPPVAVVGTKIQTEKMSLEEIADKLLELHSSLMKQDLDAPLISRSYRFKSHIPFQDDILLKLPEPRTIYPTHVTIAKLDKEYITNLHNYFDNIGSLNHPIGDFEHHRKFLFYGIHNFYYEKIFETKVEQNETVEHKIRYNPFDRNIAVHVLSRSYKNGIVTDRLQIHDNFPVVSRKAIESQIDVIKTQSPFDNNPSEINNYDLFSDVGDLSGKNIAFLVNKNKGWGDGSSGRRPTIRRQLYRDARITLSEINNSTLHLELKGYAKRPLSFNVALTSSFLPEVSFDATKNLPMRVQFIEEPVLASRIEYGSKSLVEVERSYPFHHPKEISSIKALKLLNAFNEFSIEEAKNAAPYLPGNLHSMPTFSNPHRSKSIVHLLEECYNRLPYDHLMDVLTNFYVFSKSSNRWDPDLLKKSLQHTLSPEFQIAFHLDDQNKYLSIEERKALNKIYTSSPKLPVIIQYVPDTGEGSIDDLIKKHAEKTTEVNRTLQEILHADSGIRSLVMYIRKKTIHLDIWDPAGSLEDLADKILTDPGNLLSAVDRYFCDIADKIADIFSGGGDDKDPKLSSADLREAVKLLQEAEQKRSEKIAHLQSLEILGNDPLKLYQTLNNTYAANMNIEITDIQYFLNKSKTQDVYKVGAMINELGPLTWYTSNIPRSKLLDKLDFWDELPSLYHPNPRALGKVHNSSFVENELEKFSKMTLTELYISQFPKYTFSGKSTLETEIIKVSSELLSHLYYKETTIEKPDNSTPNIGFFLGYGSSGFSFGPNKDLQIGFNDDGIFFVLEGIFIPLYGSQDELNTVDPSPFEEEPAAMKYFDEEIAIQFHKLSSQGLVHMDSYDLFQIPQPILSIPLTHIGFDIPLLSSSQPKENEPKPYLGERLDVYSDGSLCLWKTSRVENIDYETLINRLLAPFGGSPAIAAFDHSYFHLPIGSETLNALIKQQHINPQLDYFISESPEEREPIPQEWKGIVFNENTFDPKTGKFLGSYRRVITFDTPRTGAGIGFLLESIVKIGDRANEIGQEKLVTQEQYCQSPFVGSEGGIEIFGQSYVPTGNMRSIPVKHYAIISPDYALGVGENGVWITDDYKLLRAKETGEFRWRTIGQDFPVVPDITIKNEFELAPGPLPTETLPHDSNYKQEVEILESQGSKLFLLLDPNFYQNHKDDYNQLLNEYREIQLQHQNMSINRLNNN